MENLSLASLILGFVALERLAELWLARQNTASLILRGAVEYSPGHYPLIVVLHAVWLTGLFGLAWNSPVNLAWLAVFAMLQLLRIWVLSTLGSRWTTRIIIVPGEPLVRTGPYRIFSHPNYAVVVGEMAVLPLVFDLPAYALLFSILNGVVLYIRIKAENLALAGHAG